MNITFLITTYHRKESCQKLVNTLRGQGNIVVVQDGCDYSIDGCDVFKTQEHQGKLGYWRTVNRLFNLRIKSSYFIMLPDDFMPRKGMVEEAIMLWDNIDDKSKICLNLYADRIGIPCWTRFNPVDMGSVYRTQWVDMCFFCEESFFTALGEIPRMLLNWEHSPRKSSGVGRYISLHLHQLGYNLYQVKESLVEVQKEHDKSQMKQQP